MTARFRTSYRWMGILFILFSINAFASKFKGYRKSSSVKSMVLTESVDRFEETQKDFLILLSRHPGLYRFPKTNEYASQIRDFLKQRIKSKHSVVVTIDPTTAQILSLEDTTK